MFYTNRLDPRFGKINKNMYIGKNYVTFQVFKAFIN